jgi:hypothetical protein
MQPNALLIQQNFIIRKVGVTGKIPSPQPIGSPPHSSSTEALPELFRVRQSFSALVCSSAEALPKSYGFVQGLCSSTLG